MPHQVRVPTTVISSAFRGGRTTCICLLFSHQGIEHSKIKHTPKQHTQAVRDAEAYCIEEENKRREAVGLPKVVAVNLYAREGSNDVSRAVEGMITSYMARATRGAALQIMALGGAITQPARNARMRDKAEAVARIKGCKSKILSHRYAPNTAYVR